MCASASLSNTWNLQIIWRQSLTWSKRCFFGCIFFSAFDRVYHDGLVYKLKVLGICGRYYNLLQSFLNNRHERDALNGQSSKWSLVEAGVPLGSISGRLLFLVYINDLPQRLRCNTKLIADDTSLFSTITSPVLLLSNLNEDLLKTTQWAYQCKMLFIPDKKNKHKKLFFLERKMIQVI